MAEEILSLENVSKNFTSGSRKLTVLDNISFKVHEGDSISIVRTSCRGKQTFQFLPTLTALENVLIPLELRGQRSGKQAALELLEKVGLADRSGHYPSQLSGGEQQRVAIARAFITRPKILFADEPTGNLDEETATTVTDLLFQLNRDANTTLVLVTHNMELAHFTERILELRGGKLHADRVTAR